MYHITFDKRVLNDIKKISRKEVMRIKKAISQKLTINPLLFSEPLYNNLAGYRKLRVGDYRVIFTIDHEQKTLVVIIAHRKDVYKKVTKRID